MLTAKFVLRNLGPAAETPQLIALWRIDGWVCDPWLACNYNMLCRVSDLPESVLNWILAEQPALTQEAYALLNRVFDSEKVARVLTIFVQGGIGDANA